MKKSQYHNDLELHICQSILKNWTVSTTQLRLEALTVAYDNIEAVPKFSGFSASNNFIERVRKRFFGEFFSELYVADSELRPSPRSRAENKSFAGKGLYSIERYNYGAKIGHFIGEVLPMREYNAKLSQGLTSDIYAIQLSSQWVLDCTYHAKKGFCKLSRSNTPYGTSKYLLSGGKAFPNCHLKIILPRGSATSILPPASLRQPYAYLIAGRVRKADETDTEFDRYKNSFQLMPNTEILWDYGKSFVFH
jgi:hypothetical protein